MTPPTCEVSGVAPWYGSQAGINATVLSQLGDCAHFYDVCCGGCSLLIAKPRTGREVLNDLHGGLINLCRVLASHRWKGLADLLGRTVTAEPIFAEAVAFRRERGYVVAPTVMDVTTDHVQAAYYQFIEWWMGAGGEAGTAGQASSGGRMSQRHSQGGGAASTRFATAVGSIEWLHHRLQSVEVWQQDLFELIPKIKDERRTCIYCDPPFIVGGDRYEHAWAPRRWDPAQVSMFGDRDEYDALFALLGQFDRARVVVRHYAHPRLAELAPSDQGWMRIPIERTKNSAMAGQGFDGEVTKADELLLVRGGLP